MPASLAARGGLSRRPPSLAPSAEAEKTGGPLRLGSSPSFALRTDSNAARVFACGAPRSDGSTMGRGGRASLECRAVLGFGRRGKRGKSGVRKRDLCPCGSELRYDECCKPYHDGDKIEPDAESLLKARYSAYVKKEVPYVCETTHPDNPAYEGSKTPDGEFSSTLEEDVRATCRTIDFQSLELLGAEECDVDGHGAENCAKLRIKVEFKVTGQKGYRNQMQSFTEVGTFVRDGTDSRWLYLGGEVV